ncbi:ribosomal protein S8 [Flavobacterium sp. HSC-32F16]|uniref:hypothetical protein n=1 Tax=Flavobacterium sp. HSC-32F16 TaxID=2910964 RepID=UPI0020A3B29B|nr:hypothetical protein [Flavobacterium sp. HSC-32F16]MCP2027407.1 ribosomal protein S8 [Flavobacterium sp. HSC-32F16]
MRKTVIAFTFLFIFFSGLAQKSSPVAGDAAALIDLLKKDYNTVNPDTRNDELNTDRGKAIAIFKSYLKDSDKPGLSQNLDKPEIKKITDTFVSIQNYKDAIAMLSKGNLSITEKTLDASSSTFVNLKAAEAELKASYYENKSKYDINELDNLAQLYFSDNPYLCHVAYLFIAKYELNQDKQIDYFAEKNSFSSVQKSLPFLGGDMAFETVIDGLSRFLAKRIKEELTVYAIDKIRTYLENPTPKNYCYELLVILPETTNYLKKFEASQLLNFTDQLKQHIEEDLNNLLKNAANLKSTPSLKNMIAKNPDLEFAFEGLELIPQLSKIKSPVDYFEILENSRTLARWRTVPADASVPNLIVKYNIAQSLRLASMLAYSFTIVENAEVKFATVDFAANYGNEVNFYFLYFGMLHQQNVKYFDINFLKKDGTITPFKISEMMEKFPVSEVNNTLESFIFLKSNMVSIAENAEKIYAQSLAIKKKKKNNEELKYEEIYGFVDDIISFSEEVVKTADLMMNEKYHITDGTANAEISFEDKTAPYFNVAKIANTIVLDLSQKKYSNAVIKAVEIPLNFRKADIQAHNLLNMEDQIVLEEDLNFLSSIFKPDAFSNPSILKNVEKLKGMESRLKVIAIKMGSDDNLKALKKDILAFSDYASTVDTVKISELDDKIKLLKESIKNGINSQKLMEFYGISNSEIEKKVLQQLAKNGYNEDIQKEIWKLIEKYLKDKYLSLILHDELTGEQIIETVISEFIPQLVESYTKINDIKAIRLIYFINDIAASKDSKDVEKAIEAFALPVGSSSLKEKSELYFSINAFPGVIAGAAFAKDLDAAFTFGFTAPVGFYLQPWSSGKKGGSLGFFIPIIDIAAPVKFRIDGNNDTKTLPDFNFDDIFSPGLYLTYGFRKSPFALSLGGQYGPKLRDIPNDADTDLTSVDSWSLNLSLTIDIPLLTLSSKYKD